VSERPSRPAPRPVAGAPVRPGGAAGRPAAGGQAPRRPGQPQGGRGSGEDDGPSSELQPQLDDLERQIERRKVAYQRYFAGDLQHPPEDLRQKVDERLRRLRSLNMRRSVDHFRFGALEARFNSYREMFQRRVRAVEEGRVAPRRPPTPAAPRFDVEQGVLLDASPAPEAVEALFQGLCDRSPRGPAMDLDTFRTYLARQVVQIREKTGCAAVQFRVLTEEGKVKVKAKPVGAAGAGGR
jgi:hypothetical protein